MLPVVERQVALAANNSLALPCHAERLLRCDSLQALRAARHYALAEQLPLTLLGGGSNTLLAPQLTGLVVKIEPPAKAPDAESFTRLAAASGESVLIDVPAGVNWSSLVDECVAAGLAGIENLALIPGTVGAAPIQNIGAYGVELTDCLESVLFYHWQSDRVQKISAEQCQLGYRDSCFKHQLAGQGAIVSVRLRLECEQSGQPRYQTAYPGLAEALASRQPQPLNALRIANAVKAIRRSKLPDPAQLPNAGSFFKNPLVDDSVFKQLLARYPSMPHYPQPGRVKIPAAWLLEQSGLKGYRRGAVATHPRQPLVVVNHGGASLAELLDFADHCAGVVEQKFAIVLEREPQPLAPFVWTEGGGSDAV